eukprot:XP_001690233.1 predicted protein [Chlamydomonas reinhardtii]
MTGMSIEEVLSARATARRMKEQYAGTLGVHTGPGLRRLANARSEAQSASNKSAGGSREGGSSSRQMQATVSSSALGSAIAAAWRDGLLGGDEDQGPHPDPVLHGAEGDASTADRGQGLQLGYSAEEDFDDGYVQEDTGGDNEEAEEAQAEATLGRGLAAEVEPGEDEWQARKHRLAAQGMLPAAELAPEEWARIGPPQDATDAAQFVARSYTVEIDMEPQTYVTKRVARPDIWHISKAEMARRQATKEAVAFAMQAERRRELEEAALAAQQKSMARSTPTGPRFHGGSAVAMGHDDFVVDDTSEGPNALEELNTAAAGLHGWRRGLHSAATAASATHQTSTMRPLSPMSRQRRVQSALVGPHYFTPQPKPEEVSEGYYAQMLREQRKWLNAPAQPPRPASAAVAAPPPASKHYVRPKSAVPAPDGTAPPPQALPAPWGIWGQAVAPSSRQTQIACPGNKSKTLRMAGTCHRAQETGATVRRSAAELFTTAAKFLEMVLRGSKDQEHEHFVGGQKVAITRDTARMAYHRLGPSPTYLAWAEMLAKNNSCGLYHSSIGENLAASWGSASNVANCTRASVWWYGEEPQYDYSNPGNPKNASDVIGHFTAMVWRNLTRVGCGAAVATHPQYGYCWVVACQYRASMNIYGYYGRNVLPPIASSGPANCTAPGTGWCNTTAGAVQSVVDCDGDGGLDVACREPGTTRRGVVLSTRSCRNDTGSYMNPDLGTMAWPSASPVFCPAVFGYDLDLVTAWAYGGGAYEVWRGNASLTSRGVSWGGNNVDDTAVNNEAITWSSGSSPDPTQYHVCVRWYAAVRYFLLNVTLTIMRNNQTAATFTSAVDTSTFHSATCKPGANGFLGTYDIAYSPDTGINTTVLDNDIYVLWYAGSVLNVASYFSNSTKGTYFGDNVGLKVNEETVYWPPGTMPDVAEYSVCLRPYVTRYLELDVRLEVFVNSSTVPTAVISTRLDTGRYGFIGEVESCSSTTPGFMGRFNYTGANIVQTAAPAAPPNPPTTSLRIRSRWDVKNPGTSNVGSSSTDLDMVVQWTNGTTTYFVSNNKANSGGASYVYDGGYSFRVEDMQWADGTPPAPSTVINVCLAFYNPNGTAPFSVNAAVAVALNGEALTTRFWKELFSTGLRSVAGSWTSCTSTSPGFIGSYTYTPPVTVSSMSADGDGALLMSDGLLDGTDATLYDTSAGDPFWSGLGPSGLGGSQAANLPYF